MTVHTLDDVQRDDAPSALILTLQDIDNRDENGGPFELTANVDQIIAYLDGPLRHDVIEPCRHLVDVTIDHVRAARIDDAIEAGKRLGVYLSVPDYDGMVAA